MLRRKAETTHGVPNAEKMLSTAITASDKQTVVRFFCHCCVSKKSWSELKGSEKLLFWEKKRHLFVVTQHKMLYFVRDEMQNQHQSWLYSAIWLAS